MNKLTVTPTPDNIQALYELSELAALEIAVAFSHRPTIEHVKRVYVLGDTLRMYVDNPRDPMNSGEYRQPLDKAIMLHVKISRK